MRGNKNPENLPQLRRLGFAAKILPRFYKVAAIQLYCHDILYIQCHNVTNAAQKTQINNGNLRLKCQTNCQINITKRH